MWRYSLVGKIKIPILLCTVLLLSACIKDRFTAIPNYANTNLDGTIPFDTAYVSSLEGIYELAEGDNRFGQQFAAKWANGYLCLFGQTDGRFINVQVGYKADDSTFRMAGFYHFPLTSGQGQIQFTINKNEGVDTLLNHGSDGITLRGYLDGDASKAIVLRYKRPFSDFVLNRNFSIAAHRGGGRNADNLPYAENSLELVKHVQQFGATGIEIDVRLTKDKVPLIYHDADINIRLTQKSPLVGNLNKFNAEFIRAYIRLVDGQVIPTMEEMLNTIIDSTTLQNIWLDCKDGGEAGFYAAVLPEVRKAMAYAQLKNRTISVLIGLPSQEAYDRFKTLPNHTTIPSLCELSIDDAIAASSNVFAPRWTLGILTQEAATAHANNMRVVTWTLDDPASMNEVITNSEYDGILTNYPSMLAYQLYSQE